ncbi:hypothetical protein [Thalassomonas actiniarum]|uniref:Uncharacterized protein n=1 Tax=Thalassomonas actiniarum TaxID=485447 RepID=A0AAF0C586_9GAMM|nr:hypothetical protein [Thalassomonas actiniarum]WDE01258.1 hypothetical protein SG35_011790 [Thalassomonas actiniarum]
MKLKLNKKKLKNLSKDNKTLPMEMTDKVAGGAKEMPNTTYIGITHC